MPALTNADLTTTTLDGTGIFDVLMRAAKAHLEEEFKKGRLKGPEYSTVYLGSMEAVLKASLDFLLQKNKNDLEATLLQKQIELAEKEVLKAAAELDILEAQLLKVPQEVLLLTAQTALTTQQTANAVIEGTVLTAQKCKLDAEFDLLQETKLKTVQEKELLLWKVATEKAQTLATGVDDNSVVGKQKLLYAAQTAGFTRDAEQKVAKLMSDTWNVRRTTDEATAADPAHLGDTYVARAVDKMLTGVGA